MLRVLVTKVNENGEESEPLYRNYAMNEDVFDSIGQSAKEMAQIIWEVENERDIKDSVITPKYANNTN